MYMKRDVYRAMIERSNFRNYLSQYVNPSITRPNFETSRFGSLSTRTKRLRFSFHPIPNRKKSETILVFRLEFRVRIIEFLAWLLGPIAPPFDPSPFHDPSREIAEKRMRKRNFHLRRSRVFHELFTRVRYSQISSTPPDPSTVVTQEQWEAKLFFLPFSLLWRFWFLENNIAFYNSYILLKMYV